MAISKIDVSRFMEMADNSLVIDVRSPSEYGHAHIPGAYSLPLFTDEERKVVGTIYKQQSREEAIKKGLDFFGVKMRQMVEEVEQIVNAAPPGAALLVHCWRGGMRSAGVAWLLDLYGFRVYTLAGGYKSFRHWVLSNYKKAYPFKMIGGYTGSGKTALLKALETAGKTTIDLEHIAGHKGSAFGAVEGVQQPGQEMFENILAIALYRAMKTGSEEIWMEDESQRIGLVNLPGDLWKTMRDAPLYFLDIPFEERLAYIVQEYGGLGKKTMIDAVGRIQKRLGGLDAQKATGYLEEDNITEAFRILLKYYDKQYSKALQGRENLQSLLREVNCSSVDPHENIKKLMAAGITA
jgi:tRNA 2-selenouridine synthase